MELSRMENVEKLEICRIYARGGWACLPLLWAVNFLWFYKDAFKAAPYQEQKWIRQYVIMSGAGALVWSVLLISWIIVYQTHRAAWDDWGDALSFLIPTGGP